MRFVRCGCDVVRCGCGVVRCTYAHIRGTCVCACTQAHTGYTSKRRFYVYVHVYMVLCCCVPCYVCSALWLERVIVSQMATVYTPPISTRDVTLIITAILINDLGCSVYACMLSYEVSTFLVSGLAHLCASSVGSTPHWDRPQTGPKRRCLQVCVWNAF